MYYNFPKNRIRNDLWHRILLKLIGNLDKRIREKIERKDNILTSDYSQSIMSKVFGV